MSASPSRRVLALAAMSAAFLGADAALSASAPSTSAPAAWGDWKSWGDQRDGTYRNPVLPGDYSDLDCIRVGSDYYAISSTFQYSPGVVVLHSKDLVNWTILGHAVDDVTQIGPALNWDRMDRYGRGVWAGAIRHHNGRFWIYFGTPDEGYFMTSAADPAGPWEPLHRMTTEAGWDDCCPFWDDDGQGYFVGTNFKTGYNTYLYKLTPDHRDIIPESATLILTGKSREASKLYKVDGTYYHFFSEARGGARYVMMQRAPAITGPYTGLRQITRADRANREPNQGGIIQTEKGEWFFFTHHGAGDWEGRCASLLPVTWIDGWPIIGEVGEDGLGGMVWSGRKPVDGLPPRTPQSSDDFSAAKLPPQWEWNYQPRAEKWSLSERPGFLRLKAFKPLRPDDLKTAGNTLTQRVMRSADNVATAALDLAGLAEGQIAGLCYIAREPARFGVRRKPDGTNRLEFAHGKKVLVGPAISEPRIQLRSTWGLDGLATFSFSVDDGRTFSPCGEPYQFTWGHYRGTRIGLFTYNNLGEQGHVDIDWFTHTYSNPTDSSAASAERSAPR